MSDEMSEHAGSLDFANLESSDLLLSRGGSFSPGCSLRHPLGAGRVAEWAPLRCGLPILAYDSPPRLVSARALVVIVRSWSSRPSRTWWQSSPVSAWRSPACSRITRAASRRAGHDPRRPYQPGDWIKLDRHLGEVKQIGVRPCPCDRLDTSHHPAFRLCREGISNDQRQPQRAGVANFDLHPDHDGEAVRRRSLQSGRPGLLMPGTQVNVVAQEKPWGTHYK